MYSSNFASGIGRYKACKSGYVKSLHIRVSKMLKQCWQKPSTKLAAADKNSGGECKTNKQKP